MGICCHYWQQIPIAVQGICCHYWVLFGLAYYNKNHILKQVQKIVLLQMHILTLYTVECDQHFQENTGVSHHGALQHQPLVLAAQD